MIVTDCLKERYQSRSSVPPTAEEILPLERRRDKRRQSLGMAPSRLPYPTAPTRPDGRRGGKLSTFALHLHYYVICKI